MPGPFRRIVPTSQKTFWPRFESSPASARSSTNSGSVLSWRSCSISNQPSLILKPRPAFNCIPTPSGSGGNVGPQETLPWRMSRDGDAPPRFPPRDEAILKAIACETRLPLSRLSLADLTVRANYALASPSAGAPFGASSTAMRSNPGGTSTGSSPATPVSRRRPESSSISTQANGRARRWAPRITSLVLTRRQASRLGAAATRARLQLRDGRNESSSNMNEAARCNTWPPGTSAGVT